MYLRYYCKRQIFYIYMGNYEWKSIIQRLLPLLESYRCCNYKRLCKFYAYPTVTSKIGGVITNCILAWVHVISLSDSWNSCATDNVKLIQCLNYVVAIVFVVAAVTAALFWYIKIVRRIKVSTNFRINAFKLNICIFSNTV